MNIPKINLKNMLDAISAVNHVLNETVTLVSETKTSCPDCKIDPVRKESTNPNCETCEGSGYMIVEVKYVIPASVEQQEDFRYEFTKAGRITNGEIYLTVDIKEIKNVLNPVNKYNLDDYNQLKAMVESFEYINWMGGKYKIKSFEPGMLQGNLFEIGFVLSLVE